MERNSGDHPALGPDDQPEHEKLYAGEIDLTGSIEQTQDLLDVIGDAITEAGKDGEVPEWGARVIARYLADLLDEPGSALHHFAVTGRTILDRLGDELRVLWDDPERVDLTSDLINRLGTFLIAARRQRAEQRLLTISDELRAAVAEHGPAFEAFLQLPDVTEANALAGFHESYYASFPTLDAIADHVAQSHEVYELLEDASLSHLASPDPRLLLKLARQRWDIVPHNLRFYLFEK